MLPRPRTLFLLLGMIVVVLGLYGLFNTTVLKLDAEASFLTGTSQSAPSKPDPGFVESFDILLKVSSIGNGLLVKFIKSTGNLFYCISSNVVLLALAVSVVVLGARLNFNERTKPKWFTLLETASRTILCAALLVFVLELLFYASRLSINHWWAFLLGGGAFCLSVILFNSEELTEKWMTVVSKSSQFVGLAVLFLLGFYCFAINRYSSQTAQIMREQNAQDRGDYRNLVKFRSENSDFAALLSQSEELINSDRAIALNMARYIYKESAELRSPETDFEQGESKTKAFTSIFPPPRLLKNRDRWLEIRDEFLHGDSALQSFDSYIQRCLFGNEDLRLAIPYRSYLDALREERIPRSADTARVEINADFRGNLEAFKKQLRLRSLKELDDVLPHCEILYTSSEPSQKKKAEEFASKLRSTRKFAVPAPKFISLNSVDKQPGVSLSVFARGDFEYRANIIRILEATGLFSGGGDLTTVSLDAELKQFCDLTFEEFDIYSDETLNQKEGRDLLMRLRARLPSLQSNGLADTGSVSPYDSPTQVNSMIESLSSKEKRVMRAGPRARDISNRMRLLRELTTLSVLLEYGKPENHFEIWVVPEEDLQSNASPEGK